MNEVEGVNSQIIASVVDVNMINSGYAPSHSFGVLETVFAETMGMAMHNAVARQHGAGTISSASVAAVCARLISVPYPAPPPLPPLPPPSVHPLGPWPATPAEMVADASGEASEAVELLQMEAAQAEDPMAAALAVAGLKQIAEAAAPIPPPHVDPVAAAPVAAAPVAAAPAAAAPAAAAPAAAAPAAAAPVAAAPVAAAPVAAPPPPPPALEPDVEARRPTPRERAAARARNPQRRP
jgi:hypothetical protein